MTERVDERFWKQIGAILGGLVAIATIHALVVVPAILDTAKVQARTIAQEEVGLVRDQLNAHLADVETIRANLVTKGEIEQLSKAIEHINQQLDRMEARLTPR